MTPFGSVAVPGRGSARWLRAEGVTVAAAGGGAEGLAGIRRRGVDVVVLDLGLPDLDGVDVLRTLRGEGSAVPVLVFTARDAIESRVAALEAGPTTIRSSRSPSPSCSSPMR